MSFSIAKILPTLVFATAMATLPVNAQSEKTLEETYVAIVENYANIGQASYQDALTSAQDLRIAIEGLLNNPTEETMEEARDAWRTARIPYEQSEVFVHANEVVKNWENRVNAWPIIPSFIDYVAHGTGDNIINSLQLEIAGTSVSLEKITPELIANELHLTDHAANNVASGYHVIEFLLWGEDNSGDEEKDVDEGAGQRPPSDFDLENCTNDNCERRGDYLYASTNLLIDDLEEMVEKWQVTGDIRRTLLADPKAGMSKIFSGLGSLSFGELAGDRLQNSLTSHHSDSEQDRFSNNSHISYLFNARGVSMIYFGAYYSLAGELTQGASLADFAEEFAAELDDEFRVSLGTTMARMRLLVDYARDEEAFDLMIAQGNKAGNGLIVEAVDALLGQTKVLRELALALDLDPQFSGSDALQAL